MPVLHNTGDWFNMQAATFRKFEIYNMEWPIETELEKMRIFASTYAGPIAIIRDSKQIVKVVGSAKPTIRIFTCSGHLISSFQWNSGTLITMGWSDSEELICIQDDGTVLIYDMFGNFQQNFSMGQEAKDTKIIDARIFPSSAGTGVAVLTKNFRVFLINNIKERKNRQLPEIPNSVVEPTSWEIISEDRNTYSLIAIGKDLFTLTQGDSMCSMVSVSIGREYKSIIQMGVSFNHKYLALYTNNGIVWMGTADLRTKLCEFDTGRAERPHQITWIMNAENCSEAAAVCIAYQSLLIVISVSGDMNLYTYEPTVFLIPEMDGVRVLTNHSHEMIQMVPKSVNNIFSINSQAPSSFLFEAHKKYCERSHQSDEYLCLMKEKLKQAVDECLNAAGYEFDSETQKSLMNAAYFGKSFLKAYNPEEYVKMCRMLRVLNAIRHHKVGMCLTKKQLTHLKPHVLLDRLVFRKQYALAIQIAKHLKLPESRILEHWAFHKVVFDKTDDSEVARRIQEKFNSPTIQGVSFCNIAQKAMDVGRTKLAIKLLEMEPKPNLQVPLLLKLGENKKALLSATQSGDTDLVYAVLLQLKETTQLADFQMTIRAYPMAQNLYKKYCQMYSKNALLEIQNQEDDHVAQALFALREGFESKNVESSLPTATAAFKRGQKDVEAELCEDARKLMKQQKTFSEKYSTPSERLPFNNLSVHDTIKQLLRTCDIKAAEKMKTEHRVPDKRYWIMRIQVLAEQRQWDELEKFSKLKKKPIGYEAFVEVCLKQNKLEEAQKYLPKCRDDKKIVWYIRAGLAEEAARVAFEQKDLHSLNIVHMNASKTRNKQLIEKINNYIAMLSAKK